MSDEYVLAGDVGGTNLRVAAIAHDGRVLHVVKDPTPDSGTASEIVEAIASAAEQCIQGISGARPSGFGVAIAALVNQSEGLILSSPNMSGLNGLRLADVLSGRLGLDVVVENDATSAAIGEHWLGAAANSKNSITVTLGTGIGGGLILDGRPYRGADGTAGEIGHICVEPEGISCGCGSRGCVEQYASATAIVRIACELAIDIPAGKTDAYVSAEQVYEAARDGDEVAVNAFRKMGRYLGMALGDLIDVLNPELIVIGGGVAPSWDFFIDDVRDEIRRRAFKHPAETANLVRASLGDSAGILGAARVILESR
jgi:glucokinase